MILFSRNPSMEFISKAWTSGTRWSHMSYIASSSLVSSLAKCLHGQIARFHNERFQTAASLCYISLLNFILRVFRTVLFNYVGYSEFCIPLWELSRFLYFIARAFQISIFQFVVVISFTDILLHNVICFLYLPRLYSIWTENHCSPTLWFIRTLHGLIIWLLWNIPLALISHKTFSIGLSSWTWNVESIADTRSTRRKLLAISYQDFFF